ncbi:hypothetical protein [Actinocorallia longicatena]|uniref:Dihydrodipicolinate reductase n=1 Tax=Actinocorallia longicatena TaxID=111803 RepID=A0ABP6Q6L8_9ACTN
MKVVQWATGNIGSRALRGVIEHPELSLAGVYVNAADKAGVDAGKLCGLPDTGVTATADIADVLAAGADCVLYMPRLMDLGEVCRILESGANVVTTCGTFHHPAGLDPQVRERVEAACSRGGTSLHATGSSPGFITEALPLVLASLQRRLDSLAISESADLSRRNSPELLFGIMGFGTPPAEFARERAAHIAASFGPSLRQVAEDLGLPLDSIESDGECAVAPGPVTIAAGTIPAGTVAAQRMTVSGVRGGRTVLSFQSTWYCTADLDPAWRVRDTGWHVSVAGDAPLEVSLLLPVPLDRMAEVSPGYTANRAVNAVRAVCEAPPGILTARDLPHLVSALVTEG